ncbi:hypothetical protein [Oceaniglobus ichthyenteri]|uniref:hypothetical protein n=1 Tax=Oceaniglobus ichthyenteri TaxID=2136177 RepID=UPI000D349A84|nr:hypothetical protein [Oceaniglobus ichthyenteri]
MWTLRALLLVFSMALAGCDSPSLAFQGMPSQTVAIGPSTFSVRMRGDRVESLRTSREWRPREADIMARAAQAMERATGCPLRKGSLIGDQAIQRAKVVCGNRPNPPPQKVSVPVDAECLPSGSYVVRGRGVKVTEVECETWYQRANSSALP